MEEKVVKFEIGKILAVVIAVVAVVALAGVVLQSNLFQGNLAANEIKELCEKDPKNSLCLKLGEKELDRLKACDYNQAELEQLAERPAVTSDQMEMIEICLKALQTPLEPVPGDQEPASTVPELVPVSGDKETNTTVPELEPIPGDQDPASTVPDLEPIPGDKEPASTNPDLEPVKE